MALDHNDFLRLSRIAESLRRSDPALARKLAAPMGRRPLWTVILYMALSVFALPTLADLAVGDATTPSSIAKSASAGREDGGGSATTGSRPVQQSRPDHVAIHNPQQLGGAWMQAAASEGHGEVDRRDHSDDQRRGPAGA
jgi:hypothetical protein